MNKMENKTLVTILRWIAVLPAAVLGAIVGNLIGLMNSGGYSWYTGGEISGLTGFVFFVLQNLFVGAGFVAAGWYVAPRGKRTVAIVLATLAVCVCALSIFLAVVNDLADWKLYLSAAVTVGGAIGAAVNLDEEK